MGIDHSVVVIRSENPDGWIVNVKYPDRTEELERFRGGTRIFRDAQTVLSVLSEAGVEEILFQVRKVRK